MSHRAIGLFLDDERQVREFLGAGRSGVAGGSARSQQHAEE
jgi:hypothetical protein